MEGLDAEQKKAIFKTLMAQEGSVDGEPISVLDDDFDMS